MCSRPESPHRRLSPQTASRAGNIWCLRASMATRPAPPHHVRHVPPWSRARSSARRTRPTLRRARLTSPQGRCTNPTGGSTGRWGESTCRRGQPTARRGRFTLQRGGFTARPGELTAQRGEFTARRGTLNARRGRFTDQRGAFTSRRGVFAGDRHGVLTRHTRAARGITPTADDVAPAQTRPTCLHGALTTPAHDSRRTLHGRT